MKTCLVSPTPLLVFLSSQPQQTQKKLKTHTNNIATLLGPTSSLFFTQKWGGVGEKNYNEEKVKIKKIIDFFLYHVFFFQK
jgi:hypothetical protein